MKKFLYYLLLGFSLFAVIFVSRRALGAEDTYSVMINKYGNGKGLVASPNNAIYCTGDTFAANGCTTHMPLGEKVVLIATPDNGSNFTKWENCDEPAGNRCTFIVKNEQNVVKSHFNKDQLGSQADYVVESIQLNPTAPKANQPFTVTAVIKNVGQLDEYTPFKSIAPSFIATTESAGALSAYTGGVIYEETGFTKGESRMITFGTDPNQKMLLNMNGTYTLIVTADINNYIYESDESNNSKSIRFSITDQQGGLYFRSSGFGSGFVYAKNDLTGITTTMFGAGDILYDLGTSFTITAVPSKGSYLKSFQNCDNQTISEQFGECKAKTDGRVLRVTFGRYDETTTDINIKKAEQKLTINSAIQNSPNRSLAKRLAGHILLQVEENGESWYVDTVSLKRFYLKNGEEAYRALRKFGVGVSNADIQKIPIGVSVKKTARESDSDDDGLHDKLEDAIGTQKFSADSDNDGFDDKLEITSNNNPLGVGKIGMDQNFTNRLRGKIILQVQSNGEAWYVNPNDGKRYYVTDGDSAYNTMRHMSLGVSNQDLEKIDIY